ncbi:hypothetical protein LTV02_26525 [Nocardia yamanashiensis]|uniref:hypothetical protein n=1 Tax=Nocardia yamanashiensis TaxID=209247 RepID=UPI001E3A9C95|nr:hypothetical protein [Nocardia yamanashiensis]UGT39600.1 hypothetical protein LTV02_26525 [Nocardia yamanashiensis]
MTFDPAGKTIDEILDYGAPGLQYWEHFLPLYEEAFGPCRNATLPGLQAAYDEQRGTDLAKLDATRAELAKALENAETQWQVEQTVARDLTAAWIGGTGDQALMMVDAQLRRARADLDATRTATDALGAVAEPLRQAVLAKAHATLALLPRTGDGAVELTLGGKSPDDIDTLIADQSDPWLTDTFRPDVERKLDLFTTACTTADAAFETHYASVIAALNEVVELPFPCPRDIAVPPIETAGPSAIPPGCPAPSGGSSAPAQPSWPVTPQSYAPSAAPGQAVHGPSGEPAPNSGTTAQGREAVPNSGTGSDSSVPATAPGTTPSADPEPRSQPQSATGTTPETAPATTGDASPSSATTARSLSSGLESLTSAVQQGITDTLTKLRSLVPGSDDKDSDTLSAAPEAPKSETDPGSTAHKSEFDLAGKHFTLEQLPDGELRLTVTDETGGSHTYTLSFDEHGIPVLTESTQPPDGAADSAGQQADSPPIPTGSGPTPDTDGRPDSAEGSDCPPPTAGGESREPGASCEPSDFDEPGYSAGPEGSCEPGRSGGTENACEPGRSGSPENACEPGRSGGAGESREPGGFGGLGDSSGSGDACPPGDVPSPAAEPRDVPVSPDIDESAGTAEPPPVPPDQSAPGAGMTGVQPGGGMCSPPGEDGAAGDGIGPSPRTGPGAPSLPDAGQAQPPLPESWQPPLPERGQGVSPGDGGEVIEIPDAGVEIPGAVPP